MAEQAMIHITMGAQSGDFASGTTAGQAIRAMLPAGQSAFCAMQGGVCVELSDPLTEDCVLEPLTYQDEEGRRVYERSLRFLFLLSLKRLYPDKRARMLNSVGWATAPVECRNHLQTRRDGVIRTFAALPVFAETAHAQLRGLRPVPAPSGRRNRA